jgi:hypothetical protein
LAINDPTTAVLAIDQLHRLLRLVGKRTDEILDSAGELRVVFRTPNWEDFVNLAPCPHKVALGPQQEGEVEQAPCRIGMLRAEHLLADSQSAFEERLRLPKVALRTQKAGGIIEAQRRPGVLRAQHSAHQAMCAGWGVKLP